MKIAMVEGSQLSLLSAACGFFISVIKPEMLFYPSDQFSATVPRPPPVR
jgi:hypothetical protein